MNTAHIPTVLTLAVACSAGSAFAQGSRLLRHPTASADHVAFSHASDIWIANRDGGDAQRLTSFPGMESNPNFSPDGNWIAFSAAYDGNTDVYLVSSKGGEPQRLTHHPGGDIVRGWTPDGSKVIFASGRDTAPTSHPRFWTVSAQGGTPEPLPMPRVYKGGFSQDQKWFAYQQIRPNDEEWRIYRGGQAKPIWLLNMENYALTRLPWEDSMDTDPVWLDGKIYFLSDRDHAVNVYSYDPGSERLRQVTHYVDFDAKHLSSGGGVLVYEYGGYIHLFDPDVGAARELQINARGDMPWTRPHWESVGNRLSNGSISPTGKRAVFEARGDIFTIPADKGDVRNLTQSSGVADRNPVWSPDGEHIAWFSDASGEYQLMIGSQDGMDEPRAIALSNPTFYFTPAWSPDSKHVLFTDEGLNLSYVNVESGEQFHVDTDQFAHPQRTINPVWSPDSNWIAYAKRLDNHFHAIMVYSLKDRSTHQITDGMSDAISPAWDRNGKYLYFLASTDFALNIGWLDMSSYERPVRRAAYFAVLQDDEPSPLLPESDDEPVKEEESNDDDAASQSGEGGAQSDEDDADQADEGDDAENGDDGIRIDFDGIDQRILALSMQPSNYAAAIAGPKGVAFIAEAPQNQPFGGLTLHRHDMKHRSAKPYLTGISAAVVSADGKKLLYAGGGGWGIVGTSGAAKVGDGRLSTNIQMHVHPRAEWRQMFREAWRYQRDFLYVDNLHGADWDKVWQMYEPWLDHVGHRADLVHLLDILGGEVSVGHSYTFGGDMPDVTSVPGGLLGADYTIQNGRFRISKVFTGENWNPNLRAPLSAPGIDVGEGDYLLAVNGVELTGDMNVHSLFERTANRQTVITVNSAPNMDGARQVTVVPVGNEAGLRSRAWVENNRRIVDEMSGGRLAYVWLPNTGQGGYTYFNRYYFAQQHKKGAIIDERYNGGGSAADYMVDIMSRELQGFFNNPVGERKPFTNPGAGIWGPKVMIINDAAGSGGDLLPWMFSNMKIGPLVGSTTWGGLVGIWDVPPLIDGGSMTAPRGGFYNNEGEWDVENIGVPPDIHVEQTPREVIAGGDPQLEAAIREALRLLDTGTWPTIHGEPDPPVRALRPRRR